MTAKFKDMPELAEFIVSGEPIQYIPTNVVYVHMCEEGTNTQFPHPIDFRDFRKYIELQWFEALDATMHNGLTVLDLETGHVYSKHNPLVAEATQLQLL